MWMRNFVSDIKGQTDISGIWEKGAEGNIWTEKGWSNRRLEKLHNEVFYNL
jgi:hypothetical protein